MSSTEDSVTTTFVPPDPLDPPSEQNQSRCHSLPNVSNSTATLTAIGAKAKPEMHLVLCGISKKPNVFALLQTAVAFGVRQVLVVGQQRNLPAGSDSATNGTLLPPLLQELLVSGHLALVRFHKWRELAAHLRRESISLIGVEIHPQALDLKEFLKNHSSTGEGDVAFVMGNEGDGLSPQQMADCDGFVRIPQHGAGTASVNVAVAAGIVLHRFHEYQRQWPFERQDSVMPDGKESTAVLTTTTVQGLPLE